MNTSLLSTSKDKEVVEFFSELNQQEFVVLYIYVIHNKNNRQTALDIGSISHFPVEKESADHQITRDQSKIMTNWKI
jgi:hypothetical protein